MNLSNEKDIKKNVEMLMSSKVYYFWRIYSSDRRVNPQFRSSVWKKVSRRPANNENYDHVCGRLISK